MSEGSEWYQIGPKWAWETPWMIKDQFGIIQNLQTSPIPQNPFLDREFFASSYSKTALPILLFGHKPTVTKLFKKVNK